MKRMTKRISLAIFILLGFLALIFLTSSPQRTFEDELSEYIKKGELIVFDSNFYEEEKSDIAYRWLSRNATITLVIPYDQAVKLEFILWSYNIPRNTKVYLNYYLLTELNLTKNRTSYTSPFVYLKRGLYKLKFLFSGDCEVPALRENTEDTRCLGIAVGNFKKIETSNLAPYIDSPGWYELESYYGKDLRWTKDKSIIKFINLEEGEFLLNFFAFSLHSNKLLKIYVDSNLVYRANIPPNGMEVKAKMSLDPGLHSIILNTSCSYSSKLGISTEGRCLGIAVVNPIISHSE
jgi:hypothetical protein